MSRPPRLFCLDTVMIDVVMTVAKLPSSGADVLARRSLLTTGGGFNAMSAAARQGMAVAYAGKLGDGPFSAQAETSLRGEGIVAPIGASHDLDAGFCVVIVEDTGERTFLTSPGAENGLTSRDLGGLDVAAGDFVLVSGYNVMYPGMAEVVLGWLGALDDGAVVVVDPSNRVYDIPAPYLESVLARADWIVCNETEALELSGVDDVIRAAQALARRTRKENALVRHGASGCTVVEGGAAPVTVDAYETEVVDTNGAGDTHNGVFIAELARGVGAREAARWANAAASLAISQLGPATCPARTTIRERLDS